MEITNILSRMGYPDTAERVPFQSAEDGAEYAVWKVTIDGAAYVLKKAKGHELAVYSAFFKDGACGAPRFFKSVNIDGEDFFLMEYIQGKDLLRCDRESLKAALDALISLQDKFWEKRELECVGFGCKASLPGRQNRGKYLNDPELEQAYDKFLKLYETLPRTLCHDDLLPFNVLIGEGRATIIDWEQAGILPYPTSLARLIAHGEENEDAFFYMKEADRAFAIEYYYENLVKKKGIPYADYRNALGYFLLYEYCEWIMLGNRYADADRERYHQYYTKAKAHIKMR